MKQIDVRDFAKTKTEVEEVKKKERRNSAQLAAIQEAAYRSKKINRHMGFSLSIDSSMSARTDTKIPDLLLRRKISRVEYAFKRGDMVIPE